MQACVHPKVNDIYNETFASTYILFLSKSRFTLAYKNKQTNKQAHKEEIHKIPTSVTPSYNSYIKQKFMHEQESINIETGFLCERFRKAHYASFYQYIM